MTALAARLGFFLRSLGDFLYPPACLGCDNEIDRGLVCSVCTTRLYTNRLGVCTTCGRPVRYGARCGQCQMAFSPTKARALGPYAPPYSNLVQALKYDSKTALARILGNALAGLVETDPELAGADCICAIPLHRARRRERGYNQAALLAAEVASGTGLELIEPLVRVKNTQTQTGLTDAGARASNVRGAFRLKPEMRLGGKSVILVDDVMTSGATLDAAGRQLLAAGADAVFGLVVAAA